MHITIDHEKLANLSLPALQWLATVIDRNLYTLAIEQEAERLECSRRTIERWIAELRAAGTISTKYRRRTGNHEISLTPTPAAKLDFAATNFIDDFRKCRAGQHYAGLSEEDYIDFRKRYPAITDFDFHLKKALKSAYRADPPVPFRSLENYVLPDLERVQKNQQENPDDPELDGGLEVDVEFINRRRKFSKTY